MGNTLPKRKDAPGSLAAEEREKEREITEDNQLIVYKVAYTEAMHSGSLIANHHGKAFIPTKSWRSFRNHHSMARRRSRIAYAPKSRRKRSVSNQSAPAQGIGLKEKETRSKRTSVSPSSSSQDHGPREEVHARLCYC